MKKYGISVIMALFVSLLLLMPVQAENSRVVDGADVLETEEETKLETQVKIIRDMYQVDVVFVTEDQLDGKTTEEYANAFYDENGYGCGEQKDGLLLLVDLENYHWHITMRGAVAESFSDTEMQSIGDQMNDDLSDGEFYIALSEFATAFQQQLTEKMGEPEMPDVPAATGRLVDGADLLTEEQEIDLLEQLNEISERQKADVVVVTQEDIGIRTPMQFADDFFDYNGYGMGPDRDGILLLISMAERDWWISTSGFCVEAFTDAGIEYIGEEIKIYLSEAEYDNAFAIYAEQCDLFLTQAKEGEPFDEGNMPKRKVDPLHIPICLVVGFLISFVLASRKKAALKSVRANDTAREYAVPGSMTLTIQRDQYLNKTVTTRIIQKKSSSGGSSTHRSSSGRSHGGGGGKF